MDNRVRKSLLAQKRAFEVLGMKLLSSEDKKVVRYVNDQICSIKTGAIPVRKTVTIGRIFPKSIENLRIFGDDEVYSWASQYSSVRFMPVYPNNFGFSCYVSFDVDEDTMKPIKSSGTVDHFKIPQIMDTNSKVHLTHELIHAVKETNYDEYILVAVVSDVIPIFYELIGTDDDIALKRDIMSIRMTILNGEAKTYNIATTNMKQHKNDKDLYKLVQSRSGQYLNSFYYALILYNMYKSNPSLILDAVNKVLRREITTLEMLEMLGIYTKDNNELFDNELDEIRKILK